MPGFVGQAPNGFTDRAKGRGIVSNAWLAQVGSGGALSAGGGNIYSGLVTKGNGADTTEDTAYTVALPANTLDVVGRCITIQAFGSVGATSATKTVKFYWGTSIIQQIVQYTTTNTGDWQLFVQIFKDGPSTQRALIQADGTGTVTLLGGAANRGLVVSTSGTETDTAAITMKVTCQTTAGAAGLVNVKAFIIDAYN